MDDHVPESVYDLSKKNLDDDGPATLQGGGKTREKLSFICSTYFADTHEVVACTKDAIYCSQHNFLTHPKMCDLDVVQQTFYHYRGKTFILLGSTRLSVWDGREGYRKVILDRALDAEVPPEERDICACCLDAQSSRLFLAFSDGNINVYAADSVEERLSQLSFLADDYVVEMLYSSHLQLLICVTNGGALLLVCQDPDHSFTFYQRMSTSHLANLTVSEALGRVAFADDDQHVFYYETKIKNQRQTNYCEVTMSQPPRRLLFLGSSPVLLSVHGESTFVFWHCPASNETGLEQLLICDAFRETTLRHFIHFTNRLCGTGFQRAEPGSEAFSKSGGGGGGRRTTAGSQRASRRASRRSVVSRGGSGGGGGGGTGDSLASTLRGRPHTSESAATAGKESAAEELLSLARASESKIVKKNQHEVTCVAFDDRTHRLFVGDSVGFVNTYSTCALFQAFGIHHVLSHAAAVAFPGGPAASPVAAQQLDRQLPPSAYRAARPLHTNSAQPHGDSAVVSLRWVPEIGTLLSTGDDRAVALLSGQGDVSDYLVLSRLPTTEVASQDKEGLAAFRLPAVPRREGGGGALEGVEDDAEKLLYCSHVSYETEALQQALAASTAAPQRAEAHDDTDNPLPFEENAQSTFTLTSRTRKALNNKWPRRRAPSVLQEASHAVEKKEGGDDHNNSVNNTTFSYTVYLEECRQQQQQQQQQQRSTTPSTTRSASPRASSPPPLGCISKYPLPTEDGHHGAPDAPPPTYDCLQFSTSSTAATAAIERGAISKSKEDGGDDDDADDGPNASGGGSPRRLSASRTKELEQDIDDHPFHKSRVDTEIVNLGKIKDTTSRPFHMPLKALYASEIQAPYYPWMEGRKKETAAFSLRDVVAANFHANAAAAAAVAASAKAAPARPGTAQLGAGGVKKGRPTLESLMVVSVVGKPPAAAAEHKDKTCSTRGGRLPAPIAPPQRLHPRSVSTPHASPFSLPSGAATTSAYGAAVCRGLPCRRPMTTSSPPLPANRLGSQRDALFQCSSLTGMVNEYDRELRRCLQGSHGKKKGPAL